MPFGLSLCSRCYTRSWSMARCVTDSDCLEFGIRLSCIEGECGCNSKNVLVEQLERGCYPKAKLFTSCEKTEQCLAMNRNTYCNPNYRCTCSAGYYFDGRECIIRYDTSLKAQEVYKAAVVAAACFIVAVVGIFVACIVRRSFCRREGNVQHASSSSTDVFSISDEIAALRAVDKPPSYEEVLQIERTFYGIPPPEYSSLRGRDYSQQYNQNAISHCEVEFANQPDQSQTQLNELERNQDANPIPSQPSIITAIINNCDNSQFSSAITMDTVVLEPEDLANANCSLERSDSLINSSPSHLRRTPSSPTPQGCGVAITSSASAPSSPHLLIRAPTSTFRGRLLHRISSLRLCSRPAVPASGPNAPGDGNDIPLDLSSVSTSVVTPPPAGNLNSQSVYSIPTHGSSLSAYDNPAFIGDPK